MSRHGSEREVNQISSAVPLLCIYSSTAETIKAEKCLSLISNWLSTLGKGRRVHLEEMFDRSSSVSM